MLVTRFAPSPTGLLHLGHAYAALYAWRRARDAGGGGGGRFLLRLEDIDEGRCREEFAGAIVRDLAWLGLDWDGEVRRQSRHLAEYSAALARLERDGLLYPCFCTRADIARALDAPQGPEGPVYPGTCRALSADERAEKIAEGRSFALRLDVAKALARTGPLAWQDEVAGTVAVDPLALGDVVLGRKDAPTSYHLAVTLDDAAQGVSLVTRGADLFAATHVHRLLQALFDLPVPLYHHHRLLTDAGGRRLAKRDKALTLASLRQSGLAPEAVRAMAESDAT